jgi:molybdate transport system substrate-binding protein
MDPRGIVGGSAPALIALLAACTGQNDTARKETPDMREAREPAAREDALVVFAAVSLREAFTAIGRDFEHAHPGMKITFNFAGTQELRTQLEHGAAADVFASADQRHMDELLRARRVTDPVVFARNEPVVVVAKAKAAALRTFADLPSARRIVVGAEEVPIGRYTLQILERVAQRLGPDFRARVDARVVSRELNVRQVLAKVSLDEADAGIVYRTDAATAADKVTVMSIPEDVNVIAEYPIAAVAGAAHPALARAWVALVLSTGGQQALAGAGFLPVASGPRRSP